MIIIEAVLMGIFATYFMDFLAGILAKRNLIYPFISPEAIGRWFLYIFKGKLIHKDINKTPVLKNEKLWCLISHYLIVVVLSGVYLVLGSNLAIVRDHLWMPLLFGIATVFFPWFWLLPSIGIGFMAGFVGLIVHALGANTFTIVRIMEPFWFFVGIITVLPTLERQEAEQIQSSGMADQVAVVN